MAIESWEHVESVDLKATNKDADGKAKWIVRGAGTEEEALAHLIVKVPIAILIGIDWMIRQTIEVKHQGAGIFLASVQYGPEDDPKSEQRQEPGDWKFDFDTTGGKHKLSIAEKEILRQWAWSAGSTPPDLKGAINYDGKKVHGVDIIVPNLEFSITVLYHPAAVTMNLIKDIARNTGKVNKDVWLGFDAGEILFMGGNGSIPIPTIRGAKIKPVPITYKFGASENRNDIVIGSNPQPIKKKGWEYLWVRYERMEEGGLDFPVPVHVYVDQVYKELAFKPFFKFG